MKKKNLFISAVLGCGTILTISSAEIKANEENNPAEPAPAAVTEVSDTVNMNISLADEEAKIAHAADLSKNTADDTSLKMTLSNDPVEAADLNSPKVTTDTGSQEVISPVSGWSEDGTQYKINDQFVKGEYQIGENWYYFDANNDNKKAVSSFIDMKDAYNLTITKYYDELGKRVEGQKKIEDHWYYFDPKKQGTMAVGQYDIPAGDNYNNAKTVYYASNGQMQYGQVKVEGKWKYFDQYSGAMARGETKIPAAMNHGNSKTVFYNNDGSMFYGQKKVNGKWKYYDQYSGAMATGETLIPAAMNYNHAKWVYFNEDGTMYYGQKKVNGKWKYFDEYSGQRAVGETLIPASMNYGHSKWCFFNEDGSMYYGQKKVNGSWKYFDQWSGQRASGETLVPAAMNYNHAKWCLYDKDGRMQYGLHTVNNNENFYDLNSGEKQFNKLISINNKLYYFDAKGNKVIGKEFTYNGSQYKAAPNTGEVSIISNFAGYKEHGMLSVKNGKLVDQYGHPMQLKGISTHGIGWFPQYVNQADFNSLAKDWNANVIRLAMYTAEYNGYCTGGNQANLRNLVKEGVNYATAAAMYAIVDWHILSDGNPLTHMSQAKEFFNTMSYQFRNQNNVLYEICNEPNGGTSWSDIKKYAETIIPIIRKNNPNAIVIVGTPTWSQDVDQAAANPIKNYNNVMYTLHFYAATHKDDLRNKAEAALKKNLPIFVTEFGISDASGNGGIDTASGQKWIDLLNKYNVSYAAWNLSNKNESSSLIKSSCSKTSGFTDSDLTASGKFVKNALGGKGNPSSTQEPSSPVNPDKPAESVDTSKVISSTSTDKKVEAAPVNNWQENGKTNVQYNLTFTNNKNETIHSWSMELDFGRSITIKNSWNVNASVKGNKVILSNVSYNGTLAPKGKAENIGLVIQYN